jgi:hypothetical protein
MERTPKHSKDVNAKSFFSDYGLIPQWVKGIQENRPATSGEWIVYLRLFMLSKTFGEDSRLTNLVGILGPAVLPNLTPEEKENYQKYLPNTTPDAGYKLDDRTVKDLRYLWTTFDLKKPADKKFAKALNLKR